MSVLLSKESVLAAMRSGIPDAEWLLRQIESQEGWFRFPQSLSEAIRNLKIHNYPLLYESELAIVIMMLRGFLDEAGIKELLNDFEAATLAERADFIQEVIGGLDSFSASALIPKTEAERLAARERFEAMAPEEQQEAIKLSQHIYSSFLATFNQYLSMMVHGEKLTSLVAQAKAGDDRAFVKAVQIDRRILTTIPYFRERYACAQDEANSEFYDLLSYRLGRAPYRGKIRHKSLWLAFSIMEQAGLLDTLSHREILEMCDEAGVGGHHNRIQSEKHLGARLHEYREFQKRGIVTTS